MATDLPQPLACLLADSLEKRANSSVGLFVTVPGALTKKAYEQACQRLVNDRKLAIPGFRKGQKVPEQVLLNAVGGPGVIINEALDILCEDALKKAIDDSDIKAVGQVGGVVVLVGCAVSRMRGGEGRAIGRPRIAFRAPRRCHTHHNGRRSPHRKRDRNRLVPTAQAQLVSHPEQLISSYKPGEPLVMELTVDVYPEVTFTSDYKGLPVTVERVPAENQNVQVALDALRKKRIRLVDTAAGYAAQLNDSAIVNMVAYQMLSDGTRGPEMKNIAAGEGVEVVLEERRFLPGVVEAVVGKKAGDAVNVPVTFPAEMRDPKLAGLKVEFEIEVVAVKNRVVPEIDEQFAKEIRPDLTPEAIKQEVIDAVNADAEERTKANRNRELEEALLKISAWGGARVYVRVCACVGPACVLCVCGVVQKGRCVSTGAST